jgi:type IV pilus biogenesis protein CpaD/CtpE
MRKNPKKIALIGLAASVLFGTAGCNPINNNEPKVYGPPEEYIEETEEEPETDITEADTEGEAK